MTAPRHVIRIEDPDDPRIAAFRSIRERDLTGRENRFIAEGTVVLRMLAAAHARGGDFAAEKLLLLENRVAGLAEELAAFPPDVPVYVASASVLDAIAGFHLHRGVLALGHRQTVASPADLIDRLPASALVVMAAGISNHDNIGSIFRNAAAFGADAVIMDATSCDPLYRKALRVSVGGVLKVPYARSGSIEENLSLLLQRGFEVWALSPAGRAEVRTIAAAPRMALITGTEGSGLPSAILDRFNTARIAQAPGLDSLNAATATGIALYEIARAQGRL
ncbi:tRNA G18 (ribose-2'-O)-methylase SpoU [Pseudorhizobium tarimense]|uniref:tRNA G18 (Ribose-2'-O)-methylase SpoU n=1 Tax=Pseudorhizobium tarimense TaxID=1079109 RepID=A0ABV2H7G6_9HYPH|nr:RNA methyltransferase [Pseudorhizobium tarimense]MCJ8519662.1 RNA methyltransferase [Pseudorhizobium tarimense]